MTEGVMKKVRLGRTDLMVAPVCFGTSASAMSSDTYGYDVDAEQPRRRQAIFDDQNLHR